MDVPTHSGTYQPMVAVVAKDAREREALAALIWITLGYDVRQAATLAHLNDRTAFAAVVLATEQLGVPHDSGQGPGVVVVADSLNCLAIGQHRAVLARPVDAMLLTEKIASAVAADSRDEVQVSGPQLPAAFRLFS